jgi:hypothetical protein
VAHLHKRKRKHHRHRVAHHSHSNSTLSAAQNEPPKRETTVSFCPSRCCWFRCLQPVCSHQCTHKPLRAHDHFAHWRCRVSRLKNASLTTSDLKSEKNLLPPFQRVDLVSNSKRRSRSTATAARCARRTSAWRSARRPPVSRWHRRGAPRARTSRPSRASSTAAPRARRGRARRARRAPPLSAAHPASRACRPARPTSSAARA